MGKAAMMKPHKTLPIIVLSERIIFPGTGTVIETTDPKEVELLKTLAESGQKTLACGYSLVFGEGQNTGSPRLYKAATECEVVRLEKIDGGYRFAILGTKRLELESWSCLTPFPVANFSESETVSKKDDLALAGLAMSLGDQARKILPRIEDNGKAILANFENTESVSEKADMVVFYLAGQNKDGYQFAINHLSEKHLYVRVRKAIEMLANKRANLDVQRDIQKSVNDEQAANMGRYQKHQMMEAIQKELAEIEKEKNGGVEADTLEDRVKKCIDELKAAIEGGNTAPNLAEAHKTISKEFKRYSEMNPMSQEANTSRDYLDWLVSLPWLKASVDKEDIPAAREILDADHYGMKKIKKRILEFLAIRKLSPKKKAPILCFVGPPGVGKTSIGKSLARAMGREFYRQSLGGVQDEAAIRGHRRTYVGALPGRIIQMIKHVGVSNPVLMLDEVDKLTANQRGDPASALLEALDPEQNHEFSDHYVAIPFDLSKVVFICTANYKERIPPALYDRMEVIELSGYTPDEKFRIASDFLLPKQLKEHGLSSASIQISRENILRIVEGYTSESGVRNLEREIANIIRGAVVKMAEGLPYNDNVSESDIAEYLGPSRFEKTMADEMDAVGVSTGLFWSQVGGGILPIQVALMPNGTGTLEITGGLKDPPQEYTGARMVNSMRESILCALTYVRSRTDLQRNGETISPDFFLKHDFHISFPSIAIPKDGPSAGLAIATAFTSLATGKPVNHLVAMTGEMSLKGRALPIGGLKEKILGAHRAGIKKILIPVANGKDLVDVPDEIKRDLEIIMVSHISEVLPHALVG